MTVILGDPSKEVTQPVTLIVEVAEVSTMVEAVKFPLMTVVDAAGTLMLPWVTDSVDTHVLPTQ